jgi:hypothetical protein
MLVTRLPGRRAVHSLAVLRLGNGQRPKKNAFRFPNPPMRIVAFSFAALW